MTRGAKGAPIGASNSIGMQKLAQISLTSNLVLLIDFKYFLLPFDLKYSRNYYLKV